MNCLNVMGYLLSQVALVGGSRALCTAIHRAPTPKSAQKVAPYSNWYVLSGALERY